MERQAAQNVPVTVLGTWNYPGAAVVVGTTYYGPSNFQASNVFWYVVIDLTDLNVVVNEIESANDQVPASVQQYAGNPDYLLIFTTVAVSSDRLPTGPLYQFLKATGAGPEIDRAEQIGTALGTGTVSAMSYILAATMNEVDGSGFEEFDFTALTVMTFELMPITVQGKTIYTPIRVGG